MKACGRARQVGLCVVGLGERRRRRRRDDGAEILSHVQICLRKKGLGYNELFFPSASSEAGVWIENDFIVLLRDYFSL